jgi:hypothetical protein
MIHLSCLASDGMLELKQNYVILKCTTQDAFDDHARLNLNFRKQYRSDFS